MRRDGASCAAAQFHRHAGGGRSVGPQPRPPAGGEDHLERSQSHPGTAVQGGTLGPCLLFSLPRVLGCGRTLVTNSAVSGFGMFIHNLSSWNLKTFVKEEEGDTFHSFLTF